MGTHKNAKSEQQLRNAPPEVLEAMRQYIQYSDLYSDLWEGLQLQFPNPALHTILDQLESYRVYRDDAAEVMKDNGYTLGDAAQLAEYEERDAAAKESEDTAAQSMVQRCAALLAAIPKDTLARLEPYLAFEASIT